MKKVAFYTLGCKLNFYETSAINLLFEQRGFCRVNFKDHTNTFVINTCSVTDKADKKCQKIIKDALQIKSLYYRYKLLCTAQTAINCPNT